MAKIWLQIVVSLIFVTIAMGRKVMWYFSFVCHLSISIPDEICSAKIFVISRKWKTILILAVLRMWRGEGRRGQLSRKRPLGWSPGEPSSWSWSSGLESYYVCLLFRIGQKSLSLLHLSLRLVCDLVVLSWVLNLDTGGMWRQILWTSSRGAPPLR